MKPLNEEDSDEGDTSLSCVIVWTSGVVGTSALQVNTGSQGDDTGAIGIGRWNFN